MPSPISIFLEGPIVQWQLVEGFGNNPQRPAFVHEITLQGPAGKKALAACNGVLSVRWPGEARGDRSRPVNVDPGTAPLPPMAKVYLAPSLADFVGRTNAFRDKVASAFPGLFFSYLIDVASLQTAIGFQLSKVPRGSVQPVTFDQLIRLFLGGVINVSVAGGQSIGTWPSSTGEALAHFAVFTDRGPVDPFFFYTTIRDFIANSQADVDGLLGISQVVWPILTGTRDQVVAATQAALYPFSVLADAKVRLNLSRADWRLIGDNQKGIYRRRLLTRAGFPPAGSGEPPFAFNDADWRNTFQLESVVEFYMNYREPWNAANNPPDDPATNLPGDPYIGPRDFLDPVGTDARISGDTNELVINDADFDLAAVRADAKNGDIIILDAATTRPNKAYRIIGKPLGRMILDEPPLAAGQTAVSPWKLRRRLRLVMIDPFGPRVAGTEAIVGAAVGAFGTIDLDGTVERVSPFFDTVYLPGDTARPRRTYRILAVRNNGRQLVIDGIPSFPDGASAWGIQAGVGGALEEATPAGAPLFYNLGPGGQLGFDHFDGVMFVIYNDAVYFRARWNSYTARRQRANHQEFLSSMDGNRAFEIISYRSGRSDDHDPTTRDIPFRNYSLRVVDWGQIDIPVGQPNYDHVANARFFYRPLQNGVGATVDRDNDGKTEIRIHFSRDQRGNNRSCDSAGCIVSPVMSDLRTALIDIYQDERRLLGLPPDVQVARLRGQSQDAIQRAGGIYDQDDAGGGLIQAAWNGAIMGTFWLVRPDQLPLNYAHPAGI